MFIVLEWSREILLERWVRDPDKCCQIAGVQVPISVQSTKKFYSIGLQQTNLNEEAQLTINDQTIVSFIHINYIKIYLLILCTFYFNY